MNNLSAKHYLDIYQFRLRCVEKGIAHPSAKMVAGVRLLVNGLSVLPPDAGVRLDQCAGSCRFMVADTGELIAEIEFPDA